MVTIMASEIAVRYAQGLFELTEEMNTVKKTKEEVDQQAEEIAQLKAQVAELEKGQSQK